LRSLRFIAIVIPVLMMFAPASEGAGTVDATRYEIKKFRFRRAKQRDFERLVVEFGEKGPAAKPPTVRVDTAGNGGKEATISIGPANLVGAIPEALINDSYVPKSAFLGPISINTDGPTAGFTLRTFLKETVAVDAFWLEHPNRLVLDVFPANSPRVEGRVPDPEPKPRRVASVSTAKMSGSTSNNIVCYPISAAVSAQVMFHPKTDTSPAYSAVELMPMANASTDGPEPVVCFRASSQVIASVSFKTKARDTASYVPWDGTFEKGTPPKKKEDEEADRQTSSGPNGMNPMANMPPINTSPMPGAGFQMPKPPGLVVTDITPGRTPLGSQLQNPAKITRLPSNPPPPKLPVFGEASLPPSFTLSGPPGGAPPIK
jgi:hypothetical protein